VRTALQGFVDRYVKGPPSPQAALKAFGQRVESFEHLLDVHHLTGRLLDEAMRSFDASGGAVSLGSGGRWQPVRMTEGWSGQAHATVPIAADGEHVGILQLGPRRDGGEYGAAEMQAMQAVTADVARLVQWLQPSALSASRSNGSVTSPDERGGTA
jgi:hypothetical protein